MPASRTHDVAEALHCATIDTPVGPMTLVVSARGLRSLHFGSLPAGIAATASDRHTAAWRRQLQEYFAGQRLHFTLPVDPVGTPFQKQVWTVMMDIPCGETRSYGEIARAVGRPGAARAVGMANKRNPIPVVIPCHRIIGADGSLTGYSGHEGLTTKQALLDLERTAVERAAR